MPCIGQIACLGSVTLHPAAQKKADCPVPSVSWEVGSSSSLPGLGRLYTEKASLAFLVPQTHALPWLGLPVFCMQGKSKASSMVGILGMDGRGRRCEGINPATSSQGESWLLACLLSFFSNPDCKGNESLL